MRRRSQILLSNLVITLRNNTFLTHLVFKEILDMNVQHHQLINAFDIQNPCVLKNENKCTLIQPGEIKLNLYKVMSEILLMALNNGVNIDINELYGKYRIQDLAWTEMHQDGDLNVSAIEEIFFLLFSNFRKTLLVAPCFVVLL